MGIDETPHECPPHLTVATWDYDRVRALMDGRVRIEGCDLRHIALAPEECFHRAWGGEFDVAEVGFCTARCARTGTARAGR